MREHWQSGLEDIRRTLADPRRLDRPPPEVGIVTHDVHRGHTRLHRQTQEDRFMLKEQGRDRHRIDQRHRARIAKVLASRAPNLVLNGFGRPDEIEAIRAASSATMRARPSTTAPTCRRATRCAG
jgi:hypothetical protein